MGESELLDYILANEDAFKSKARLASLYSDFSPLRLSNPDGFAANLNAWKSALINAAKAGVITTHGNELCMRSGQELRKALEIQGLGRPASLWLVVDECVAKKDLVPLKDFLDSKTSVYAKAGWLDHLRLPTAKDVAQWSLRQVGIGGASNADMVEGDFVVLSKVEAAASKVLEAASGTSSARAASSVYSLETFTHAFSDILSQSSDAHPQPLSALDIKLLLTHLTRDRRLASTSYSPSSGLTTIKLAPTSQHTASAAPPEITETDTTLAQLQTLSQRLSAEVRALETRVAALDADARRAVSSATPSGKQAALRALRSKKLAEATLARRDEALTSVTAAASDVEDAATRVEIVRALDSAGKVMAQLNRRVGGVEGVEDVLERLREGRAEGEEITAAISGVGAEGVVDEDEVEEQLEALEREDRKKREHQETQEREEKERREREEMEAKLPKVPDTEPGAGASKKEEEVDEGDIEEKLSAMSLDDAVQKDQAE